MAAIRRVGRRGSLAALLGAVVVSASLVVAGGSFAAGDAASVKTVTVGALVPLTGPDAQTGANMKAAISLALKEANSKAGPYTVKVKWIDEGSDPAETTSNYERAIVSDHIQVGFLGWRSDSAVALMPLLSRYKLPHLFEIGATDLINAKFRSNPKKFGYLTSKIYPIPGNVSTAYADAITAAVKSGAFKPKAKTVALYAEDTDWGRSVNSSMKRSFEKNGWTVKDTQFFPKETTDFSAMLAKFRSLDPAVIAGTSSISQAVTSLVKQYRSSGMKSLLVADGLGYVANWYETTGPAADGVLDEQFVFSSPAAKQFVASFKKSAGFEPSPLTAGLAYDATKFLLKVLAETAKSSGTVDGKTVFKTVQTKLWTGKLTSVGIMNPRYVYRASTIPDPVLGGSFYSVPVVQYKAGKPSVVWPQIQGSTKLNVG